MDKGRARDHQRARSETFLIPLVVFLQSNNNTAKFILFNGQGVLNSQNADSLDDAVVGLHVGQERNRVDTIVSMADTADQIARLSADTQSIARIRGQVALARNGTSRKTSTGVRRRTPATSSGLTGITSVKVLGVHGVGESHPDVSQVSEFALTALVVAVVVIMDLELSENTLLHAKVQDVLDHAQVRVDTITIVLSDSLSDFLDGQTILSTDARIGAKDFNQKVYLGNRWLSLGGFSGRSRFGQALAAAVIVLLAVMGHGVLVMIFMPYLRKKFKKMLFAYLRRDLCKRMEWRRKYNETTGGKKVFSDFCGSVFFKFLSLDFFESIMDLFSDFIIWVKFRSCLLIERLPGSTPSSNIPSMDAVFLLPHYHRKTTRWSFHVTSIGPARNTWFNATSLLVTRG